MKTFACGAVLALLAAIPAIAAEWPYDEKANAEADVEHALNSARAEHKDVLLIFGANWCGDCRALDKALHGSSSRLLESRFDTVKIDVGNFDKNLELSRRYGNPIAKGIPAVVVLDADNQILFSTKGGQLANARRMGEQGIYDFLSAKLPKTPAAAAGTAQ